MPHHRSSFLHAVTCLYLSFDQHYTLCCCSDCLWCYANASRGIFVDANGEKSLIKILQAESCEVTNNEVAEFILKSFKLY